jgi:hypothetical protein
VRGSVRWVRISFERARLAGVMAVRLAQREASASRVAK